jgi:hypothetical protein
VNEADIVDVSLPSTQGIAEDDGPYLMFAEAHVMALT